MSQRECVQSLDAVDRRGDRIVEAEWRTTTTPERGLEFANHALVGEQLIERAARYRAR